MLRDGITNVIRWVGFSQAGFEPFIASAFIGEWKFDRSPHRAYLQVYRERQEDDSVRVAYVLYWKHKDDDHRTLVRYSLDAVLRDSGVWIPGAKQQAWIDEHIEDPEWLIEPDLLEPYDLLDAPTPLVAPWSELSVWAEENGLGHGVCP